MGIFSQLRDWLMVEVPDPPPKGDGPGGRCCHGCRLWIAPTEMNPQTVPNPSARKWCQDRGRGLCTAPIPRQPGREDSLRATKPTAYCEQWSGR